MDPQVLDLSVPSRNRLNSKKSNFNDVSDSESSRGASPIENNRCSFQLFNGHSSSMKLPTRLKSPSDWSAQSDDEFDTSPPEVIDNDRVADDKEALFRNYQYSPMKMPSQGYEVPDSHHQRYGTLQWIQQTQDYFQNFEQFRIKCDSKADGSPEQTDVQQFMYNPVLDLSSPSNKSEVSPPRKGFTEPAPDLPSSTRNDINKHQLSYKPCIFHTGKEEPASPPPPCNSPPSSPDLDTVVSKTVQGITVTLHDSNLWNTFRKHGTEMIINRNGRRMFPHLDLSLQGLNESRLYNILLEVCPADDKRYKFINNKWTPVGMADPLLPNPPVLHHDSPNIGSFWMGQLSFAKIKITNHKNSTDGMIVLQSMHKYMIKVIIQPAGSDGKGLQNEIVIPLEETAFFAVTAYQNETIIQLKIHNNPFAKAFRDQRIGQQSRSRHAGKNLTEIPNVKNKLNAGSDVQNKRKRYEHLDKSKKLQCVQKSPPTILSLSSVLSESPNGPHEPVMPPYFNFNGLPYMGYTGVPGFAFPSFLPSMLYPPQS